MTTDTARDVDAGIRWTVRHATAGSRWWRDHFERAGVDPASVGGLDDLPRLPFSTKDDLRATYPLGWAAVPPAQLVRVHASSGTTGKRTVCAYTARDVDDWADQFARSFATAGVTAEDRVQVMVGYGLWTAGAGFQSGAERLGAMVVPAGPGNLDLQLELMQDMGTTVLCATSSFALMIAEAVEAAGLRESLALRVGVFGSERWGPSMRERIEALLGIEMEAGERLLAAFEKRPGFFHAAVTTLPTAWRAFAQVCHGRTTFAALLRSRAAQAALRAIS